METRRDVFHAISDPTRRAIITLIATQAMTPNSIAVHFDISRQAVSRHIKVLVECDLVGQQVTGREIYYQVNPSGIKEISDWAIQFKELWEGRFDHMNNILKKLKNK